MLRKWKSQTFLEIYDLRTSWQNEILDALTADGKINCICKRH
jgi:hypothetical protein